VKRKKILALKEKFSVKTAKRGEFAHKRTLSVIFCYHPPPCHRAPKISSPSIWRVLFKVVRQWDKISL